MSNGNALNISTAGCVQFDGVSTFSGGACTVANGGTGRTSLTNHGVLVGAATSAITQLAAGTAGQLLQSGGASADPAYSTATYPTTAGTDSTLLRSDGTNFVNTTNFKVSSTDLMTNSSQPCFLVQMQTTTGNITGDGTVANIQFDTTTFDQGSNITLNSGGKTIFTAPVTGKYMMCASIATSGGAADNGQCQLRFIATSRTFIGGFAYFPNVSNSGAQNFSMSYSAVVDMTANDTINLAIYVALHATKNVAVLGQSSATTLSSFWSGYLIC